MDLFSVIYFVTIGVVFFGAVFFGVKKSLEANRLKRIAFDGIDPAFDEKIECDPPSTEQAERLRGLVSEVVILRTTETVQVNRQENLESVFAAVALDKNGYSHTFYESFNWAETGERARTVAENFDVPFKDTSYG